MKKSVRKSLAVGLCAAVIGLGCMTSRTWADGPEVGIDIGAAVPLNKFKRVVDKNMGGTVGFWAGYRFDLSDNLALSIVAQPQYIMFETQKGCCREDDGLKSIFSITSGPKLTLKTGPVETYVGAQGGYYRDVSGPMTDDGVGFNAGGGLSFEIAENTTLGLFGRYDYMNLVAAPRSDVARQLVLAGFTLQHVFEPPPPPPERVVQAPPPPPRVVRKIVLRGVNFDFDKSNIRPDARAVLDEAVTTLKAESDIRVSVEGHTDARGSDEYNQKLSERRAGSVADYLSHGGISRGRLTTEGFGESKPVASNMTEDGRAQNRRVELRIIGQ